MCSYADTLSDGGDSDFDAGDASNVVRLPDWQDRRARHLRDAVVAAVAMADFAASCRLRSLGSSRCLDIDEFATIIIPSRSRDFLFLLRMRCGPRILLGTDDMGMLVDFVRQYVLARIDRDPVLREGLQ